MTDTSTSMSVSAAPKNPEKIARLKARYRAERRFRFYGRAAIAIAAGHEQNSLGIHAADINRTGIQAVSELGSATSDDTRSGRRPGLLTAIEKALARNAREDGR